MKQTQSLPCSVVPELFPVDPMPEVHPCAEGIPEASADDFAGLVASVKVSGVIDPVVMYDAKVLDGKQRWRAAIAANLATIPVVQFVGTEDEASELTIARTSRRNWTEDQRACYWARLATRKRGRPRVACNGKIRSFADLSEEEAAKAAQVPLRRLQSAKSLLRKSPEIFERVLRGELSLNAGHARADGMAAVESGEYAALVSKPRAERWPPESLAGARLPHAWRLGTAPPTVAQFFGLLDLLNSAASEQGMDAQQLVAAVLAQFPRGDPQAAAALARVAPMLAALGEFHLSVARDLGDVIEAAGISDDDDTAPHPISVRVPWPFANSTPPAS